MSAIRVEIVNKEAAKVTDREQSMIRAIAGLRYEWFLYAHLTAKKVAPDRNEQQQMVDMTSGWLQAAFPDLKIRILLDT